MRPDPRDVGQGDPNFDPATDAFVPDAVDPTPDTLGTGPANGDVEVDRIEIERTRTEIERTRADMSETVDAIQGRLSPENLKEQAKDRVKDATVGKAKGAGNAITETIKENPLPAALTGLGIGWILAQARKRSTAPPRYVDSGYAAGGYPPAYDQPPYAEDRGSDVSTAGQAVGRTRDKVGEAATTVQDKAGQVVGRAGDTVSSAGDKVSGLGDRARYGARKASDGFGRMLQENPLAVGVLAAGVGAAVGLAIPETARENEVMGEARDTVVEKAQEKAQEAQEKVQRVAEEAQGAAQQEAENQGLTQQ
jgi:ElaB/YqjD/DUF883 family membrane-anchored ribosome-binding protein